MPNKRFLGLGFTFSATDRGLEKKLLGIQGALSGIAESLGVINSEAASAGANLGSMKASKAGSKSSSKTKDSSASLITALTSINKSIDSGFGDVMKGMDQSFKMVSSNMKANMGFLGDVIAAIEQNKVDIILPDKAPVKKGSNKNATELLKVTKNFKMMNTRRLDKILVSMTALKNNQKLFTKRLSKGGGGERETKKEVAQDPLKKFKFAMDGLSKESAQFFDELKGKFRGDDLKTFSEQMKKMEPELDELGNVSTKSKIRMINLATSIADASTASSKFTQNFGATKKILEHFRAWFTDIGHSSDRFFKSVGVDFGTMVPEQIKAIFGVFKSIVSPLFTGLGKAAKGVFGFFKSKAEGSSQKGTLQSLDALRKVVLLQQVVGNTKPEGKSSIWSVLAMLAAPLALAAGLLIGFGSQIMKTITMFKELSFVRRAATAVFEFAKSFKPVASVMKFFAEIGGKVGRIFGRVAEFVGEFGAKIFQIGSKLAPLFENPIFQAVFKLGKFLGKWLSIVGWGFVIYDVISGIVKAFQESEGAFDFIGKALWNIADSLLMGLPGFIKDKTMGFYEKLFPKEGPPVLGQTPKGNVFDINDARNKKNQSTALNSMFGPQAPTQTSRNLVDPSMAATGQTGTITSGAQSNVLSMSQALEQMTKNQSMDDLKEIMKSQLAVTQRQADTNQSMLEELRKEKGFKGDIKVRTDFVSANAKGQLDMVHGGGG